jgi:hypothetical protein
LVSGEAYGMVNLDSGVRREDLNLKHVIGGGRALSRLDVFRARHSFGESSQPPRSPTGRVLPGRSGSGATLGHLTSASDTEWGGSEEERWAVFQEEGIRTSHLRPLFAARHGRQCIGIELNPAYVAIAAGRLQRELGTPTAAPTKQADEPEELAA